MVFDWDDYGISDAQDKRFLQRLVTLRTIRHDFRCTLFAIPSAVPVFEKWIEFAVHGYRHPNPTECADWTYERAMQAIADKPAGFVNGWKSPGWQISDGSYTALLEAGWWIADQPYNDDRRPPGLRTHLLNVGPDHWHGHVQNVCGNGLEETWDEVVALVKAAPSFEFMSEAVRPWRPSSAS